MQAAEWIALLRKIPEEYQELLMLATSNGVELAVQRFLRLDETFVLVRGRLGGTTDANRVFVVPYDYLSYVYFTRPVSDEKLRPVFGDLLAAVGRPQLEPEFEAAEEESTPTIDIAAELPQIDVSTLQPQPRTPATGPKSVAASLRERLLRARGSGPRPG